MVNDGPSRALGYASYCLDFFSTSTTSTLATATPRQSNQWTRAYLQHGMAISGRISGQDVVLEKQRGPDSSFEASRGSPLQS